MIDYDPQIPELTPTTLKNQGVLQRITDHLRSLTLYGGEGVRLDRQGYGTYISVEPVAGGGGGGEAAAYSGLWAITDKGDNKLDIAAGWVINGTASTGVGAEEDFNVSTNTFLYLEISYGGSYTIEYESGTSYPDQDKKSGNYCIRYLIAQKVDDVWQQRRTEEIHNTRSAE